MADPLLTTKLVIPARRKPIIQRQRLIEQLNEGFRRKLILLSAPAGFGKTTLLVDWIHSENIPAAWFALDETDNDPFRFYAYLCRAIQEILPELAQSLTSGSTEDRNLMLASEGDAMQDLSIVINAIETGRHPRFILVLDDYHLINESSIHRALSYLLDHLPGSMCLVITTRADPPLPLARLRGRNELMEIRQNELSFSSVEAEAFLHEVMEVAVPFDDIAVLTRRTEGWIAGLQMAAVSMRTCKEPVDFIHTFSGTHRYILDFLAEEVLKNQPEPIRNFLNQTSILDRLSGQLCDAVVGVKDSQSLLEEMDRLNLFITPLDNDNQWYRYHRLFADLLQKNLQQDDAELVPVLHQRASKWFEQNGFHGMAIDHALNAGNPLRAAGLLSAAVEDMAKRSEFYQLDRWLSALPEHMLFTHPSLGIYKAWLMVKYQPSGEAVDTLLLKIRAEYPGSKYVGQAFVINAYNALFQGNVKSALDFSRLSLQELGDEDEFFRNLAVWIQGVSQMSSSDFAGAKITLTSLPWALGKMEYDASLSDNVFASTGSLCILAEVYKRQAKLRTAKALYDQALKLSSTPQGVYLPSAFKPLIGLGGVYREWNQLDTAAEYLLKGIDLSHHISELAGFEGFLELARVRLVQGDYSSAERAFNKMHQLALLSKGTTFDDTVVDIFRVQLLILKGALDDAWSWVIQRGLDRPVDPGELDQEDDYYLYHLRKYEYIMAARIYMARGDPDTARLFLAPLIPRLEKQGRYWPLISVCVQIAAILLDLGRESEALNSLVKALELAGDEGYVRVFLDEGESVRRLLQIAKTNGLFVRAVDKLLSAFDQELIGDGFTEKTMPSMSWSTTLPEPLSEREVEVLNLLVTDKTAGEIAQSLFIAESTVRTHIKHIYAKLDVSRRLEAIHRAAELGII